MYIFDDGFAGEGQVLKINEFLFSSVFLRDNLAVMVKAFNPPSLMVQWNNVHTINCSFTVNYE